MGWTRSTYEPFWRDTPEAETPPEYAEILSTNVSFMTQISPDPILMALLASEVDDGSEETGMAADGQRKTDVPTLARRIEFYLSAVYGRDAVVTAEMRRAARDHILTAMARDLVDLSGGAYGTANASLPPAAAQASSRLVARSPTGTGGKSLWQRLASSAAELFDLRSMRFAAVPLVALLVIGSVWTRDWLYEQSTPGGNISFDGNGKSRGLVHSSHPPGTATEEDLKRRIIAEEGANGSDSPALAQLLIELGALYRGQGRYEAAEGVYKRALAIQRTALGPKDAETRRTLESLAAIYSLEGRTKEADELLSQAAQ